jgi:hypothetical protein
VTASVRSTDTSVVSRLKPFPSAVWPIHRPPVSVMRAAGRGSGVPMTDMSVKIRPNLASGEE